MKTQTFLKSAGFLFALLCLQLPNIQANNPRDSLSIWMQPWIETAYSELNQLERDYSDRTEPLRVRLHDVDKTLADPRNRIPECGFQLLWEKIQLEETLQGLSNPHNYPEFNEAKATIEDRMKKKFNFQMPALFQTNPFLSAAFSIVGLAVGGGEDKEKKENIDKIACVLDFTVRMHTDLNLIYYETGYLRDANLTLKKECEALFSDCARQIGYTIPLVSCRDGDDWERLYSIMKMKRHALPHYPINLNNSKTTLTKRWTNSTVPIKCPKCRAQN